MKDSRITYVPPNSRHQKCVINVDLKNPVLAGRAEMYINCKELTDKIYLNARQMVIEKVLVNKIEAKFEFIDPFDPLYPSDAAKRTVHHHYGYRKNYLDALKDGGSGELVIDIPESLMKNGNENVDLLKLDEKEDTTMCVVIDYKIMNPMNGVYFSIPENEVDENCVTFPFMYAMGVSDIARFWIPCIDLPREKITWEFDIITPRLLKNALNTELHSMFSDELLEQDILAICSGDLEEQLVISDELKVFKYRLKTPVHPSSLMLCVGPFQISRIPGWSSKLDFEKKVPDQDDDLSDLDLHENNSDSSGGGYIFSLPHLIKDALNTVGPLTPAMEKMEQTIGVSFPFNSFKLVFLDCLYNPLLVGAGVALISDHLIVPPDIIDQIFESRRILLRAVAAQWISIYITPKSDYDTWLMCGLCNYLSNSGLSEMFGNNESQFRLLSDMKCLSEMDVNQPPLYPGQPNRRYQVQVNTESLLIMDYSPADEWSSQRAEFIELKSALVMHMLNKRMGKGNLHKALNKIMVTAMSGDLSGLSTNHFFKTCRKVSGKSDIYIFADQWVYGSGTPRFYFTYTFNRKKMVIELQFMQMNQNNSNERVTRIFTGPLIIRVHEPTGVFDTEIMIEDMEKTYEIPYHTKYKSFKKRKPKKRKKDDGVVDEDDLDRLDEDYDDDLDALSIEWIRIDPENEWVCFKSFDQADFMWSAQLEKDKDAFAQMEAISALSKSPSDTTVETLVDIINEEKHFHRIRAEAVLALSKKLEWIGMSKLLLIYQDTYCYPLDSSYIPKANNFRNFQNYFIQKQFFKAFSAIKKPENNAPIEIKRFLIDLLKFSENTGNEYSDSFFLAGLIEAVGESFLKCPEKPVSFSEKPTILLRQMDSIEKAPLVEEFELYSEVSLLNHEYLFDNTDDPTLFKEALTEIERRKSMDAYVPSYQNLITSSSLFVFLKWQLTGLLPIDISLFLQHSRYGHFVNIRLISFDALFLLDGIFDQRIFNYILSVIETDRDPFVQYHVARAMYEYVCICYTRNQEDAASRIYGKWSDIKSVFSDQEDCKERIWRIMNSQIQKRIQLTLMRVCELVYDQQIEPIDISKMKKTAENAIKIDDEYWSSEEEGKFIIVKHPVVSLPSTSSFFLAKHQKKSREHFILDDVSQEGIQKVVDFMLEKLYSHPKAVYFRNPVDESYAPGYYQIVKKPMDLFKIGEKNRKLTYKKDLNLFVSDMNQIFENCFLFNEDSSVVSEHAVHLEAYFDNELLPRALDLAKTEYAVDHPPSIPLELVNVSKTAISIWNKLNSHKCGFWFRHPVDPIALGIPHYTKIITKPIDLSAIKTKIESYKYAHITEFYDDLKLMLENSLAFNTTETQVYKDTLTLYNYCKSLTGIEINMPKKEVKVVSSSIILNPSAQSPDRNIEIVSNQNIETPTQLRISELKVPEKNASENLIMSDNVSKCLKLIKKLQNHKSGGIFLQPVDPVALGIPNYFEVIKEPMDLSTIEKRIKCGSYGENEVFFKFKEDFDLMISNCVKFNQKGTWPYVQGESLLAYFEQLWEEIFPKEKTSYLEDKEIIQVMLQKLIAHPDSTIFQLPVDPHLYPDYYVKIKSPMDLASMKNNLDQGRYEKLEQFESDFKLMISNCFSFNAKKTIGYALGLSLEKFFKKEWKILVSRRIFNGQTLKNQQNNQKISLKAEAPLKLKLKF